MTVAIYVRLSQEDGTEQESASIGNLRLLLLDFIRNSPDLYDASLPSGQTHGQATKIISAYTSAQGSAAFRSTS